MAWRKGNNKYGAVKKNYGGRVYHSKLEAEYAERLDWRKKAGEVKDWTPQHRFDLRVNNEHWRYYKIDFRVELTDGWIEYVEIKGFPASEWKQKWDITKIIFEELTEGENARLILNDKTIKTHHGNS